MRKCIIIAAFLALLPVSCAKMELCSGREYPLTFSACSQYTVKGYVTGPVLYDTEVASLHGGTPVTTPRDIFLSAYIYPQTEDQSQTHFRGEKFSYVESEGCWSHDPVYYWPLGAKMDFLAVSSGEPFPEDDITWRATNGADQVQLVVPSTRVQDDILYSSGFHRTNEQGSVPLVFHHSQAWLELRLFVSDNDVSGKLRVTGVTLEDIYTAGVLTVLNNDGGAFAFWDFRRATRQDTPFDDPYGVVGSVLTTDEACMDMLVPEQEKKDIVIRYIIDGGEERTVRCDLPHNYWLQGGKYVYFIDFAPQEPGREDVIVTAVIVDWDSRDILLEFDGSRTHNSF